MIREQELAGLTWYWVCRDCGTERAAQAAWERLEQIGKRKKGALELGVYRHGPSDQPARFVTAVGHLREGVEVADKVLGGEDYELAPDYIHALILRRARVHLSLLEEGAPAGSYAVRRPEQRGGRLNPDGTMEEPEPGRG